MQAAKLPKPPRPVRAVPPKPVKPPKLAKVERAVQRQAQSLPRLSFMDAGRQINASCCGLIRLANGVTTVEKQRPPSYFRLTSLMVRPSVPDICHTPVFRQCLKAAGHWDKAFAP